MSAAEQWSTGLLAANDATPAAAARLYAEAGFRPIPLHYIRDDGSCSCVSPGGQCKSKPWKHPIQPSWQKTATSDLEQVVAIWERTPRAGVGLAMGGGRLTLDVDGKEGARSLELLEQKLGPLPRTLTARTGGDGEHRVFTVPPDFDITRIGNRVGIGGKLLGIEHTKVDVRADGGQIVVAPTLHKSGKRYQWIDDVAPAPLPIAFCELAAKPEPTQAPPRPPASPPRRDAGRQSGRPSVDERARMCLDTMPAAIQGQGGSRALMAAAGAMNGFALDEGTIFQLLANDYNPRCSPQWSDAELRRAASRAVSESRVRRGSMLENDRAYGPRKRTAPMPNDQVPEAQAAWVDENADVEREAIRNEERGPESGTAPTATRPEPSNDAGEAPPPENDEATCRRVRIADPTDDRPTIQMVDSELHRAIDLGIDALRADTDLYDREGALVHLTHVTKLDEERSNSEWIAGMPRVREVTEATLRERCTRYAKWEKFDKRSRSWELRAPSDAIVRGISCRGEWRSLRRLNGIIEAPSLRPDGSIIDVPGYDEATGYFYAPSIPFAPVPRSPTTEEARRALAGLEDVFVDFPYESPSMRSMAVALVLTLVARPAIKGPTPGFLFDANTPGSGKTLQADVCSIIPTGRNAGRKDWPTSVRNADEEVSKMLGAYAMAAPRMVNFDNIGDGGLGFGGPTVEMCLTAEDTAEFRILGKSQMVFLPWRTVIAGSGNNITLRRDTVRRVMLSRIESHLERPEERALEDFKHPERANVLREWVAANRASLVAAALTLLRGFVVAGAPKPVRTWSGYEKWTRLVADAIVWAGGADPLACRPSASDEANPEKRAIGVVIREWRRLDANSKGLAIKAALDLLYSAERLRGHQCPPDGFDDMREAIEELVTTRPGTKPDARALGDVFRKYKRANVGGWKLDTVGETDKVKRWAVVKAGVRVSSGGAEDEDAFGDPANV